MCTRSSGPALPSPSQPGRHAAHCLLRYHVRCGLLQCHTARRGPNSGCGWPCRRQGAGLPEQARCAAHLGGSHGAQAGEEADEDGRLHKHAQKALHRVALVLLPHRHHARGVLLLQQEGKVAGEDAHGSWAVARPACQLPSRRRTSRSHAKCLSRTRPASHVGLNPGAGLGLGDGERGPARAWAPLTAASTLPRACSCLRYSISASISGRACSARRGQGKLGGCRRGESAAA